MGEEKNTNSPKKKKYAIRVFVFGFLIANFMAFHDAKDEGRRIQADFNEYRRTYNHELSEKEKRRNFVRSSLLNFYAESQELMKNNLGNESEVDGYEKRVNKWRSSVMVWISTNISQATAVYFDSEIVDVSPRFIRALNEKHNTKMWEVAGYSKALNTLIKNDEWETYIPK